MKTFKDVYELPFVLSECSGWVYDQKRNFCFQIELHSQNAQKILLNSINDIRPLKNKNLSFESEKGEIKIKDTSNGLGKCVILIRGWGNLISQNGFGFTPKEAAHVQDTLAEYIVEKLNYREDKD